MRRDILMWLLMLTNVTWAFYCGFLIGVGNHDATVSRAFAAGVAIPKLPDLVVHGK